MMPYIATKSYGIEVLIRPDQRVMVKNLIIKQTKLPIEIKERFELLDDNTFEVPLVIYHNDATTEHAELDMSAKIGEVLFVLPEKLNCGAPIDIQFTLTSEGKLQLLAHDVTNNWTVEGKFQLGGALTDAKMAEIKVAVGCLRRSKI